MSGDADSDGQLDVGETWTYTAAHTLTQAEIDGNGGGDGFIDNLATADSNESGSDSDSAAIAGVSHPALADREDGRCGPGGGRGVASVDLHADGVQHGNVTLTGLRSPTRTRTRGALSM